MATKLERIFQKVVTSVSTFENLHKKIMYKESLIISLAEPNATPTLNNNYLLTKQQIDYIIKTTEKEIEQLTIARDNVVNNFDAFYNGWKEAINNER